MPAEQIWNPFYSREAASPTARGCFGGRYTPVLRIRCSNPGDVLLREYG